MNLYYSASTHNCAKQKIFMKNDFITDTDYQQWLGNLKRDFVAFQNKAGLQVNTVLLQFYWKLGCQNIGKAKNIKLWRQFNETAIKRPYNKFSGDCRSLVLPILLISGVGYCFINRMRFYHRLWQNYN